jgi:hypothetical protein
MSNSRQGVGKKLGTEDGRQETVLKVGIRNRRRSAMHDSIGRTGDRSKGRNEEKEIRFKERNKGQ